MTLALRFISGKYQGGEFPLEPQREVIVGRSSELDMVLVEEMVSRKHAKLVLHEGRVFIEDLGSTNGTFVNGERVSSASAGEGDRILIGSNILRVIQLGSNQGTGPGLVEGSADSSSNLASRRGVRRPEGEITTEARMSGDLEEIPLPDLLQLFGTSKKDGVLLIDSGVSLGRIVLKRGIIHTAEIVAADGGAEPLPPQKAVYRMLAWESGVFELDPPTEDVSPDALDCSVQEALMEAFRQKDELTQLQSRLPPWQSALTLAQPLVPKLSDLSEGQLEVLQFAHNRITVGAVMDTSPLSDLETAEALVRLIEKGYLSIVQGTVVA